MNECKAKVIYNSYVNNVNTFLVQVIKIKGNKKYKKIQINPFYKRSKRYLRSLSVDTLLYMTVRKDNAIVKYIIKEVIIIK